MTTRRTVFGTTLGHNPRVRRDGMSFGPSAHSLAAIEAFRSNMSGKRLTPWASHFGRGGR